MFSKDGMVTITGPPITGLPIKPVKTAVSHVQKTGDAAEVSGYAVFPDKFSFSFLV